MKKNKAFKLNKFLLPIVAVVAVVGAAIITFSGSRLFNKASENLTYKLENNTLVFNSAQIEKNVKYIDYSSDGIAMQLMAVKDSSGKNHVTLNTCQNCGISHNISQMGQQKIGCKPIPLNYTEKDGKITIALPELDQYARIFVN